MPLRRRGACSSEPEIPRHTSWLLSSCNMPLSVMHLIDRLSQREKRRLPAESGRNVTSTCEVNIREAYSCIDPQVCSNEEPVAS